MSNEFYCKDVEQSLKDLQADAATGLTAVEAAARLEKYGPNKLKIAKRRSLFLRILDQFKDFLVLILIAAAIVSVAVGDGLKDAIIIIAILVVNMIIGITQENKADDALKSSKIWQALKPK